MDKMKWIIFGVVIVGIFGAVIWFNKSDTPAFSGDASKIISDGPIADQSVGPAEQKVVLIEYGDFQCPACGRIFPTVKELEAKYPDKLTFIFRNRPLTNIHPNALAATTAAEAAGLQGKFFEMHDLLYQNQTSWSNVDVTQRSAIFEGFASQLELDLDKYRQDLSSQDIVAKIARDRETAQIYDVNSTPTFVLNGEKQGELQPEDLTRIVDEAVAKAYLQQ